MRSFSSLSEQEILALAISLEEEDARIFDDFADGLQATYPAQAEEFRRLRRGGRPSPSLAEPLPRALRRSHSAHPPARCQRFRQSPAGVVGAPLGLDAARKQAALMELETKRFYEKAIRKSTDASIRQLLGDLAEEERKHERIAEGMVAEDPDTEAAARKREFVLQVVQPGLAGLMDGSVSTLAPLFAAAFATRDTWKTFLVGLAASLGAGISMGFAEALSDDGSLTGRGRPWVRGLICGLMTALGGLGHTLPYLIPESVPNAFYLATSIAIGVVAVELAAIAWIRNRYMDTPLTSAVFQVVVGGVLVFLTGVLIGHE